jgi:hypothetical protein
MTTVSVGRRKPRTRPAYRHAGPVDRRSEDWRASIKFDEGYATSANSLSGLAVKLPDTCGKCGALITIVGPSKPPHSASLLCQSCGCPRGWISRASYAFLHEIANKFGVPTEPIVFRNRSTKPEQDGDGINAVRDGMRRSEHHANNC